jgi:hypothetical protein
MEHKDSGSLFLYNCLYRLLKHEYKPRQFSEFLMHSPHYSVWYLHHDYLAKSFLKELLYAISYNPETISLPYGIYVKIRSNNASTA